MNFIEKFDFWWNSPPIKRIVGVLYSLGASMVILGAMFKILHLPGANQVLMIGMITEAVLFALGAFDKPFEDVSWKNIFDFEKGGFINTGLTAGGGGVFLGNGSINGSENEDAGESGVTIAGGSAGESGVVVTGGGYGGGGIVVTGGSGSSGGGGVVVVGGSGVVSGDGSELQESGSGVAGGNGVVVLGGGVIGDGGGIIGGGGVGGSGIMGMPVLNDEDTQSLSESIKDLANTAKNIASISQVVESSKKLVSNLETASDSTGKFIESQESLSSATEKLEASYQSIYANLEYANRGAQTYGANVEEMNKAISSINTIYSIQLQNIVAQNEALAKQTEAIETASKGYDSILEGLKDMKTNTDTAATQTVAFVSGTEKLAKQISDLNTIYGNMLNALH